MTRLIRLKRNIPLLLLGIFCIAGIQTAYAQGGPSGVPSLPPSINVPATGGGTIGLPTPTQQPQPQPTNQQQNQGGSFGFGPTSGVFSGGQTLADFIGRFTGLTELALPIVMSLATLAFLFGGALFIFNAGNEDSIKRGKQLLFWGAIVLFLMISIWGIVFVIQLTFGLR